MGFMGVGESVGGVGVGVSVGGIGVAEGSTVSVGEMAVSVAVEEIIVVGALQPPRVKRSTSIRMGRMEFIFTLTSFCQEAAAPEVKVRRS
jgi:hypothetical protein